MHAFFQHAFFLNKNKSHLVMKLISVVYNLRKIIRGDML